MNLRKRVNKHISKINQSIYYVLTSELSEFNINTHSKVGNFNLESFAFHCNNEINKLTKRQSFESCKYFIEIIIEYVGVENYDDFISIN